MYGGGPGLKLTTRLQSEPGKVQYFQTRRWVCQTENMWQDVADGFVTGW